MQRILIAMIAMSLFLAQQNNLHAQTDTSPPEGTVPPETEPETMPEAEIETETDDEADDEEEEIEVVPVGEVAPVEESPGGGGGGGGSGAGIAIAVGAAAVIFVLSRSKNKLEKTFVEDSTTGSVLTRVSNASKNQLYWSMDYGSISSESASNVNQLSNQSSNQQQVLNWRVSRLWANGLNTKVNFGLAHNLGTQDDIQHRQWFSAGVSKAGIFKTNDNLSLSFGQRLDRNTTREVDGYFLPTAFSSAYSTENVTAANTDVFDLNKNTVEDGRYINLSYVRPTSVQSALNWQLQYSPKRSGSNYMTMNWQYRY